MDKLFIREMPTKTALRFHLTRVRMAVIQATNNSKCYKDTLTATITPLSPLKNLQLPPKNSNYHLTHS